MLVPGLSGVVVSEAELGCWNLSIYLVMLSHIKKIVFAILNKEKTEAHCDRQAPGVLQTAFEFVSA